MTLRRMMIALLAVLPALVAAAPPPGWEPPDPKKYPYRTLTDGDMSFYEVIVSRDGKLVAGGGRDGKIRLWSLETGELLRVFGLRGDNTGRMMVFTHDGKHIVSHAYRWNRKTADVEDVHTAWYETATGKEVRRIGGLDRAVIPVEVSPNGTHLLAKRLQDTDAVRVLDPETGKELRKIETPRELTGATFFREGKILAILQGNEVWRYDAKTGKGELVFGPDPDAQGLTDLHVTPGGDLLARAGSLVRIDLRARKVVWRARYLSDNGTFALRNKPVVVTRNGGAILTYEAATGKWLRQYTPRRPAREFSAMAVTPDERWLLLSSGHSPGVCVFDLAAW